jgi:DNA helicase-2/ATP-dependent DNA helicase PcrA
MGSPRANREVGMPPKHQAVLCHSSNHSGPLEVELTRRNISLVRLGGLKFLGSAHVKDMLAALLVAQNPRDGVAGFRLLQMLRGYRPADRRPHPRHDCCGSRTDVVADGVAGT